MHRRLYALVLAGFVLLAPVASATEHEEEDDDGPPDGLPAEATFGLCTAWAANERGREASGGRAGNGSNENLVEGNETDAVDNQTEPVENETGGGGVEKAHPFRWLQDEAASGNQTVEEYCAQYERPGPPDGTPGAPDGGDVPDGPPDGTPQPPQRPTPPDAPDAPPADVPDGPPDWVPTGPPSGIGPPDGVPSGPPGGSPTPPSQPGRP